MKRSRPIVNITNENNEDSDMYIRKCYSVISRYWGTSCQLIVYRIIKLVLNIMYPVYLIFNKNRLISKSSDIIVAMTTFPKRIKTVLYVAESLLR